MTERKAVLVSMVETWSSSLITKVPAFLECWLSADIFLWMISFHPRKDFTE